MRRSVVSVLVGVCGFALIVSGCGGGNRSTVPGSPSGTDPSPGTTTTVTPALRALRCPRRVALPSVDKYSGQVASVFIVSSGPKLSGCRFVTGWMTEWVRAGASPGGYAAGSLIGVRCDEPLPADQGPLGGKYLRYRGVIHCGQVDENAVDPQAQLDSEPAGFWGYYGTTARPKPAAGPAAGPPIRGARLNRALAQQLIRYARVQPESVRCPALARKLGASATCNVLARQLSDGATKLRGTVEVTIQDRAGRSAEDAYELTGAGGAVIRGTGYPFDPETGRVL